MNVPKTMNICDAIELVLSLARCEIEREPGHPDNDLRKFACDLVEDFSVNELGDD